MPPEISINLPLAQDSPNFNKTMEAVFEEWGTERRALSFWGRRKSIFGLQANCDGHLGRSLDCKRIVTGHFGTSLDWMQVVTIILGHELALL